MHLMHLMHHCDQSRDVIRFTLRASEECVSHKRNFVHEGASFAHEAKGEPDALVDEVRMTQQRSQFGPAMSRNYKLIVSGLISSMSRQWGA